MHKCTYVCINHLYVPKNSKVILKLLNMAGYKALRERFSTFVGCDSGDDRIADVYITIYNSSKITVIK